ncbi:BREX-1 system adenine-specific DNA-methyltransferase PglX [Natronorubrum halophilum]|uniref:BREX-1 system adenine-specific DNA-methyltransferase PglX n=1 Tax=Natronorubrum halophilum TaxID=1702106 RepID=UPI000EF746D3|nr:BREX-1 system adenine-specific DNA-methyltransferase PglX [Natronorubrum halophilum]
MSAKTRHNGLSADDRSGIRSTILQARKTLEEEFERQLERYGIYDDERVPVSSLSHLSVEDIATRKEIDAALERELEATDGLYGRAYRNYVREATKEYLNRLVGLKTIEARELVTETLRTRAEYGNRSYMHYTVDEIAGELTDTPDGGLGVALDLIYQEIRSEIQVLFDESDYTALEPDFAVRREVLEEFDDLGDNIWASDEAMGWVYQYFGENERKEIDDRIDEDNYKVQDTDIATKTQLFTPRYIVEWMVDNSLGRLWLEMRGNETNIDDEDKCFYLAPLEESLIDREPKDVREIKVLDPACGSGHMLLYAFDVLYEMYLEQGDVPEKYIPREILKNNLYGIDIDEGAAQIAALALYVKAKGYSPNVSIEGVNIVSANAVLVNGEKKKNVLENTNLEIEKRVLDQLWDDFEHIREWGSLVRIEERIEDIIEEEFEDVGTTGQTQFTNGGNLAKQSSVVSFSGEEQSWDQVKEGLLNQVTRLAEESLEHDNPIEEMFAGEVRKSVQLLDLFLQDYDVAITNPPYLGRGKMGDDLKSYVESNYKGKQDLYAAFIERCRDFISENGYASLITMEAFMHQYSFRGLRPSLIENSNIIDAAHIRSRAKGSGEYRGLNVSFTISPLNESTPVRPSRFYRLVNANDKPSALREITSGIRESQSHPDSYVIDQSAFAEIDRTPFVYHLGDDILSLFTSEESLSDMADIKTWLDTQGNDDRFIRRFWEIDPQTDLDWVRLVTNGDGESYYEPIVNKVLWDNDGEAVKEALDGKPRNEDWYFTEGLNYRVFSDKFCARYLPGDTIFGKNTIGVFPHEKENIYWLITYLNSTLIRHTADSLSPGLHFLKGDGGTLPIIQFSETKERKLTNICKSQIRLRKKLGSLSEVSPEFDPEEFVSNISSGGFGNVLQSEELLEANVRNGEGKADSMIWESMDASEKTINDAHDQFGMNYYELPIYQEHTDYSEHEGIDIIKSRPDDESVDQISGLINDGTGGIFGLSKEVELSPVSVAKLRYENDLYVRENLKEVCGRLLSYYVGVLFSRWDNLEQITTIEDGILVFDDQFDNNVTDRIRKCIEATFDDVYEKEAKIEELLNKNMTDWLRENFFRYHHTKKYRRRGQRIPIYWHLESDDGAFSCFLYYHAMDAETLPKLRGQYVDAKIETLENRLESIESQLEGASDNRKPELNSELEEVQEQLDDVRDFGKRLDELIDEGFEPDFEAGIWENIQQVDEYDLLQTELDKL